MKFSRSLGYAALAAWLLAAPACTGAKVMPTSATQPEHHTVTDRYRVTVGGVDLPVEAYKDIYYVNFALDGSAPVLIESAEPLTGCEVSPAARGIAASVEGVEARFTLPGAGWWVVRLNDRDRLFLLADEPEKAPAANGQTLNAADFVSGDGLQTANLQRALAEASATGRTLAFPRGVYPTGTLRIGSNTHIYLADGAIIKGSDNREDYPTDGGLLEADHIHNKEHYTDNGEWMTFSRLILIDSAENVSIRGRGIIDGSGAVLRAQGKPANLIRIRNSRNVVIEGILLRDPAAWNTHIHYSDGVTIRDVKLINDATVPNTDGFDPDASTNVMIDHCFAYCSDDNVAIKTTNNLGLNKELQNIVVRGCVFLTRKSSLKVGTETKASRMADILFENNDVVECDRALALYCNDGALFENITFSNNRVERNYPDSQRRPIHFKISERHGKGWIRNVMIRNCDFATVFPRPAEIAGLDAGHTIDSLTFSNVTIGGRPVRSLDDLGAKIRFTENILFE